MSQDEMQGPRIEDAIAAMRPDPDAAAAKTWVEEANARDPEGVLMEAEGKPPADETEEPAAEVAAVEEEAPEAEEVSEPDEEELEGEEPGDDTEESEETPEEPAFKLTLTGLDGETWDLELDGLDEQAQKAVQQLQERAQAAEEMAAHYRTVRTQAEKNQRDMLELKAIDEDLRSDPVGYIEDRINPDLQRDLVLSLLHDDAILEAVENRIEEWINDPSKRTVDAKEKELQRIKHRQRIDGERATMERQRENVIAVYGVIESMIDPSWDKETMRAWVDDAVQDVTTYASREQIDTVDPKELPKILARRAKLYGAKEPNATQSSRATARNQGGDSAKIAEAKEAGKRIKTSVTRRKRAATVPSGAGATPGSMRLPKGATLDDAFEELKKRTRQ